MPENTEPPGTAPDANEDDVFRGMPHKLRTKTPKPLPTAQDGTGSHKRVLVAAAVLVAGAAGVGVALLSGAFDGDRDSQPAALTTDSTRPDGTEPESPLVLPGRPEATKPLPVRDRPADETTSAPSSEADGQSDDKNRGGKGNNGDHGSGDSDFGPNPDGNGNSTPDGDPDGESGGDTDSDGPFSSLIDPVVTQVADALDGASGGTTSPVTGGGVSLTDEITDTLDALAAAQAASGGTDTARHDRLAKHLVHLLAKLPEAKRDRVFDRIRESLGLPAAVDVVGDAITDLDDQLADSTTPMPVSGLTAATGLL